MKFNPNVPSKSAVYREFKYTMCSCAVGTLYDIVLTRHLFDTNLFDFHWLHFVLVFLLVILWADVHFYSVHRLLHIDFLYKHVHYLHHQSFNPEPWAGLSFHPIESILYFSSLLIVLFVPFHLYHYVLLKTILDYTPAWGHLGYGGWTGGSKFHYIHHSKKIYNYGGTDLWDKVFGSYLAN